MKKNIQISIPKPCHEKWNSFTPTAMGGFCPSCEKEVIDFTLWSEERLKTYFKNASSNGCGRFKPTQLKVYEFDNPATSTLAWLPVFFTGILLLLSSHQAKAQGTVKPKPQTEQYEPKKITGQPVIKPVTSIKVSGAVKSPEESGAAVPGVNIVCKRTQQGVVTDAEGKFTLTIEKPDSIETLVFSFIGYKTIEQVIAAKQNETNVLINMQMNVEMKGEVVMIGGYIARPKWCSPRRWWWKIRSLFY